MEEVASADFLVSPYGSNEQKISNKKNPWLACIQSIRTKTIIILVVLFVLMFLAFMAIIASVVPTQFTGVEQTLVSEALLRTTRGIYDQFIDQMTIEVGFAAFVSIYWPYRWLLQNDAVDQVTIGDATTCADFLDANYADSIMADSNINV